MRKAFELSKKIPGVMICGVLLISFIACTSNDGLGDDDILDSSSNGVVSDGHDLPNDVSGQGGLDGDGSACVLLYHSESFRLDLDFDFNRGIEFYIYNDMLFILLLDLDALTGNTLMLCFTV